MVDLGDDGQAEALVGAEVLGVLPKGIASPLELARQGLVAGPPSLVPHLPADLVQGIGDPGDHVERVHAQDRLGSPVGNSASDP